MLKPMSEFTRMDTELKTLSKRIHYAKYIFSAFFLIIAGRLWYLQIYKGPDLRRYSENNRLKKQILQAPRGLILSRDQKVLTNNYLELELFLTPQYSKSIEQAAKVISPIIETPYEDLVQQIKKSAKERGQFFPISLKKQLNLKQVYHLRLLEETFPELNIKEYIVRFYPQKNQGVHLIGYTGQISKKQIENLNQKFKGELHFKSGDVIGQNGLEQSFEKDIRGQDGLSFIEVNAHSRQVITQSEFPFEFKSEKPSSGHHLVLTIDSDVQKAAFQAMNRMDRIGPRNGSAIAMKTNGEIIAWVSSPGFDPNLFSHTLSDDYWKELKKNPDKPMLNKAIQNHYPPGSIIKPLLALAALQEEVITAETLINSPSKIRIGRRNFHDHKQVGYGRINVIQAIEESSNTFFYQLGQQLGMDKMAKYYKAFGLGQSTKIHLSGEVSGFVPTTQWKEEALNEKWQGGEDLVHAIGQGYILATPIQALVAYNAIATNGKIVRPYAVQSIIDSENKVIKNISSKVIKDLSEDIDPSHFETVKQALIRVVHGSKGTARWWKIKNRLIAGKTGTSQVRSFNRENLYKDCRLKPLKDRNHGWFVAFAPADNPELTVAVLTEHSCSGSVGSAPIARDILKAYFDKYSETKVSHHPTGKNHGSL